MTPTSHRPDVDKTSVSDFYNWSRDYWIQKSKSSDGTESNMLSFGLWNKPNIDFYNAQIALHDLCVSYFDSNYSGMHGLEVGCGIGGNAIRLARKQNLRVTGLDISPSQIEIAINNAALNMDADVSFVEGSSMSMPFNNNTFDFSYCIESSFHYDSIEKFLKENHRVLKQGGLALVADITCNNDALINFKHGNHFRSIDHITNSFTSSGFEIIDMQRIGNFVFRQIYNHISSIPERNLLHRYWRSVLRNYAELFDIGVMGYDIILARKI